MGDRYAPSLGQTTDFFGTDLKLVGGFNPSEKYACQIGSFPQVGVKIKKNETTTQEIKVDNWENIDLYIGAFEVLFRVSVSHVATKPCSDVLVLMN